MKTFSKILFAVTGLLLVPAFLGLALVRRFLNARTIPGGAEVFVYSQVIWDEVWQRPQQYAWLTARQHPVIYCAPVQMHNLLYLGKKWKSVRIIKNDGRDLLVISPLVFSGHFKSRIIHEINALLITWHIRLAIKGHVQLKAMVNTPFALRVIDRLDTAPSVQITRLVFDVIDDFTIFEWSPPFGKEFDQRLSQRADAIIAGTHELASARPDTPFIPCGVDFDLFATSAPQPVELQQLPHPIVGYFGTISERIDLDLIAKIADQFPSASVVMVGPVHFPSDALPRRANIHYLGLRRHNELPAFAQHFDIGLIPFRLTEATIRLNPVKTLEYLAAGLPVVATALPDLKRFYADLVYLAEDHDQFLQQVHRAINERNPDFIQHGIDRARKASWQSMADEMNRLLFAPETPFGGRPSLTGSTLGSTHNTSDVAPEAYP